MQGYVELLSAARRTVRGRVRICDGIPPQITLPLKKILLLQQSNQTGIKEILYLPQPNTSEEVIYLFFLLKKKQH